MNTTGQPDCIKNMIHIIRGQRVMLDKDLSALYGVEVPVTSDFPIRGSLGRGFSNPHTLLRRIDESTATAQASTSVRHGGCSFIPRF